MRMIKRARLMCGIYLVELFTSAGCSSCPSADENLAKITESADGKKLPIYTLSFHVDYWNYIAWNDTFSSEDATLR